MRLFGRYEVLRRLSDEDVYLAHDILEEPSGCAARFRGGPGDGEALGAEQPPGTEDHGAPAGRPEVVLKQVRPGGERTREELAREFRTLVALAHPAIVRVLDFGGDASGACYVTMEPAPGETLDVVLPGAAPAAVRALLVQALEALAHAHRCGVLHGDLKPANIIARTAPDPRLALVDFGLARAVSGADLPAGGTPGFVAPEILAGGRPSVAADLWALGATFHAALAGAPPDAAVASLLADLLARDPAARPVDAVAALRRLGASPPPTAATPLPFVGRRVDLDLLTGRRPGVTLLRGPDGSGKSRLMREVRWRLQIDGRLVVEARHLPGDSRPLGPLPGLLRRLAALAEHEHEHDEEDSVVDDVESAAERAMADLLAARDLTPVVLVDDADLASPDAVAFLSALARGCTLDPRATIVLASAPGPVADSLAALPGIDVLDLGPLDTAEITALVAASLGRSDERLAREIYERSGGLPLLALELLRALGERTERGEVDLSARRLPADVDVEAALRAAAALAGRGAARAAFELLESVRPAIGAAAVSEPRHALAWAEIAAQAGEHAAARTMLEAAADHPDRAVRGAALLALGEAIERLGELAAARARLETALALLDAPGDRAAARLRLARVAALTGDHRAAAQHARAGLAEQAGPAAALRVQLGGALLRLNEPDGAAAEFEAARAAADEAGDRRTVAAALGHLAILRAARGDHAAARDLHERALAEAEAAGDVAALPAHLLNLATACQTLHDPAAAMDLLRRAEALARRIGRTGPLATALVNLANLYAECGAFAEAVAAAREAGETAERSGLRAVEAQAALVLAEAQATDEPAAAARHAARAREVFTAIGEAARAAEARVVEGEIALGRDDHALARTAVADARGAAGPDLLPRLDLLEGDIRRADGAAAAALDIYERALGAAERAGAADLAARAEAAIGDLLEEVGSPLAAARLAKAAERLTTIALRLPPALREAFWRVPHRARARAALDVSGSAGARGATAAAAALRLLDLAPRILAERDAQRVLDLALDAGLEVLGAERGFLLLRDGEEWRVAAARNIDRESIRRPAFKFSRSVAERVAATGEAVLTASATEDARFAAARSVHHLALQSVLCVPIRSAERVLGTIYVENRFARGRFGEEHLRLATALADQVALAIEAGRLERELRARAEDLERARTEMARRVERQEDDLSRLEREIRQTLAETALRHEYAGIVGRGPAMRRLLETLDRVMQTSLPVLVEGETGTGKELVARALHGHGPRRERTFVSVNCAALPDLLLESELFGHARGAFTGADRARTGLMREASGGTLFLDEVGEMSTAMQVKLLRAVQEGEVTPLGTDRPVPVDVRLVLATNRRLADLVAAGRFREDLYYRLNVVHLVVPPLRERREDLAELAEYLLRRAAERTGGTAKRLSRAALAALLRHDFPGNVRELENLLAAAAVFAPGDEIRPEDLPFGPPPGAAPAQSGTLRECLRAADRRLVEQTLASCGGNISTAARRLGVSRPTLYRRLAEHGISGRGR